MGFIWYFRYLPDYVPKCLIVVVVSYFGGLNHTKVEREIGTMVSETNSGFPELHITLK